MNSNFLIWKTLLNFTIDNSSQNGNNERNLIDWTTYNNPYRRRIVIINNKMRLIGLDKVYSFKLKHPDCKSWLDNWISDIKAAKWKSLNELKDRYPSASILPENTVIFNVKGNKYRLVVQLALNTQTIAVKWIGTHSEYDHKKF